MNLLKNNDWSSPYHWSGRNSLKEYLVVCTKSDEISQKPVQNTYQRMLRELEKEKERLMRNFR